MKKSGLLLAVILLVLCLTRSGCGRKDTAAAHLGKPDAVRIEAEGYYPVSIQERAEIRELMQLLNNVKVRPLSVEEELDLVLKQGKTIGATELKFTGGRSDAHKIMLLKDGSLLVVKGTQKDERREVYISLQSQEAVHNHIQKMILRSRGGR